LFAIIWATSILAVQLLRYSKRWFFGLLTAAATFSVALPIALIRWFPDLSFPLAFEVYERSGISFTHMPFFSNSVIAMIIWIALLLFSGKRTSNQKMQNRFTVLIWAWIALFMSWFSTPLTGVYITNDHFIILVVVLSWISLPLYLSNIGKGKDVYSSDTKYLGVRLSSLINISIIGFTTLFFVYILQKPLRLHVFKFDVYIIHLSIWLTLVCASWGRIFLFWKSKKKILIFNAALFITCISIGVFGYLTVFLRETPKMRSLINKAVVIESIDEKVPSNIALCADPPSASFYAAHLRRLVYPAESNLFLLEHNEVLLRRIELLASAYDVDGAGQGLWFDHFATTLLPLTCLHFGQASSWLHKAGMSDDRIDDFIGCRHNTIDEIRERLSRAMTAPVDEPAFRQVCPWVIIPRGMRHFWRLPDDYTEVPVVSDVSLWTVEYKLPSL